VKTLALSGKFVLSPHYNAVPIALRPESAAVRRRFLCAERAIDLPEFPAIPQRSF